VRTEETSSKVLSCLERNGWERTEVNLFNDDEELRVTHGCLLSRLEVIGQDGKLGCVDVPFVRKLE